VNAPRRWLALPGHERIAVIEAVWWLALTPSGLRLWGVRKVLARATRTPADSPDPRWSARRLSRLVEAVASTMPWPTTCLHRALVTGRMMRSRGIASDITIGVRVDSAGFAAHAWVADAATRDTAGYAPLASWGSRNISARR
jgi:hypothetical protein